jgi:hypothetical protein
MHRATVLRTAIPAMISPPAQEATQLAKPMAATSPHGCLHQYAIKHVLCWPPGKQSPRKHLVQMSGLRYLSR